MNRELLRMALSPYIPANYSGHNQSSAGLCLQLENFPSVLPTSAFLQKMNWFFLSSVLKCAMWVLDSSPLVSAIEICSLKHSWWKHYHLDLHCDLHFYCVILVGVFFHCWLSQESVVVNWWLPQFLSSEFAPKYQPCGLLLVDFSSNVSSPDHGLGGKDLWEPDLSHWKLLI